MNRAKQQAEPQVSVRHDPVNEVVMLAAAVVDEGARRRYLQTTPPDLFFGAGHARIWATLQEMDRQGLHYDPATLRQVGGPEVDVDYVERMIKQRPIAPPNLKHHARMLAWDAARIQVAKGPLQEFLELLKDSKSDPAAVRAACDGMRNALQNAGGSNLRNPRQLVEQQMREIEKRSEGVAVYGFGITGLDYYGPGCSKEVDGRRVDLNGKPRLIPGCAPTNVTVVTGCSGSGKTTGTAFGVLHQAKRGRRVAYGAWEQGDGMTLELMATIDLGFSRSDMMTGAFDAHDKKLMRETMERISANVLFDKIPFEHRRGQKRDWQVNDRALDRIAQSIIDSRCEVYVADLFRRALRDMDPDDEERALYRVQEMAQQLGCHIILVQQQKLKEVEATKSKLPRRDTIKGSSAWVEVADQIIGFHRPALWKNIPDDKIWSLVLKQRYGTYPQFIEHDWEPEYGHISGGVQIAVRHHGDEDEQGDVLGF